MATSTPAPAGETLERFRRGAELLALVLTGVAGEEEDFVTEPGKWSIRQITAHMADAELVAGCRMRLVIAEENPTLTAYDQDAWTRNLGYGTRKIKSSLESFRRMRAENHELLKDLPETAWGRAGTHTEQGRITLGELLTMYAAHAESHARQMQEIRDAYKRHKGR